MTSVIRRAADPTVHEPQNSAISSEDPMSSTAPFLVLTGATGNIGRRAVERLLEKGQRVRAIARSSDKLKELTAKGAEAVVGNVDDAGAMAEAFRGAAAAFIMIPPHYTAPDMRADQNKKGN